MYYPDLLEYRLGIWYLLLSLTTGNLTQFLFSLKKREAAAAGFNALTTYIAICMLFIVSALLYYGLILFAFRKISKEETKVMDVNAGTKVRNQKDVKLCNKIIIVDRIMILAHFITFIMYNVYYFITYLTL